MRPTETRRQGRPAGSSSQTGLEGGQEALGGVDAHALHPGGGLGVAARLGVVLEVHQHLGAEVADDGGEGFAVAALDDALVAAEAGEVAEGAQLHLELAPGPQGGRERLLIG